MQQDIDQILKILRILKTGEDGTGYRSNIKNIKTGKDATGY